MFGKHLIVDFFGCKVFAERSEQVNMALKACEASGATIVKTIWHDFENEGAVTCLVLLAKSHLSIHTWPESCFVAIDVFTCGDAEPMVAVNILKEHYQPRDVVTFTKLRGTKNDQATNFTS